VTAGIFITTIEPAGPGLRVAIKDLFETEGVRTTYGSAIFADHIPGVSAEAVLRLEAGGYTSCGKANLHEFAYGVTSENEHYGRVPNPLAADRTSGGSSGGSAAALAAGLADAALGTDSGGSIRIPAACCGVTGFKPTYGLVPITGCFPLAASFDHAGPLAHDVDGCERMFGALVPDHVPVSVALCDLRVGIAWTGLADPLVRARVETAAAQFGSCTPLDLPLDSGTSALFGREVATAHHDLWRDHREGYGADVAWKVERAMAVTDAEAEAAGRARQRFREQIAVLTTGVDLVVTPTVAMVAPPAALGEQPIRDRMLQFTYPWNAVGAPALALPCGGAEDGLPASVQIVGRPGDDALVLAAGRELEHALRIGPGRA
jgi:aspartyl-tRNA(Asn)/glutamyl-tRNA(Gln) amidotransferase subunit A